MTAPGCRCPALLEDDNVAAQIGLGLNLMRQADRVCFTSSDYARSSVYAPFGPKSIGLSPRYRMVWTRIISKQWKQ